MASFKISQQFSSDFARLSGDHNPLHIDPVLARRFPFGSTITHGVCGTIKALDIALRDIADSIRIVTIDVRFTKPIRNDEDVAVSVTECSGNAVKIELRSTAGRAQIIEVTYEKCDELFASNLSIGCESVRIIQCDELNFVDAIGLTGKLPLRCDAALVVQLFPEVSTKLPADQTAVLLGLTNIVGMRCPGLHSVFTRFVGEFSRVDGAVSTDLTYVVDKHDERFKKVEIAVRNDGFSGSIEAMFRARPASQPSYSDVALMAKGSDFHDIRALVVGGSRGIGEIVAKLIAGGGGSPTITFVRGAADADDIVRDIREGGGQCNAVRYDVLQCDENLLRSLGDDPITHIYYFASPVITKGEGLIWDEHLYAKYCAFYLTGMANLLSVFLKDRTYRIQPVQVFVPSTIFIDEATTGFSEYIAAKCSAEALAKQLGQKYTAWKFVIPRLPRLLTDQTSAVLSVNPLNIAEVMHKQISQQGL